MAYLPTFSKVEKVMVPLGLEFPLYFYVSYAPFPISQTMIKYVIAAAMPSNNVCFPYHFNNTTSISTTNNNSIYYLATLRPA